MHDGTRPPGQTCACNHALALAATVASAAAVVPATAMWERHKASTPLLLRQPRHASETQGKKKQKKKDKTQGKKRKDTRQEKAKTKQV
jgi:hypothetical protein